MRGLTEHALPFKALSHALRLRVPLDHVLEDASVSGFAIPASAVWSPWTSSITAHDFAMLRVLS